MTKNNKLTIEPFNGIFHSVKMCHTQFYIVTCPVLITKKANYEMREKKIFVCMAASLYHVISKEVESRLLDTIAFLDTYVSINPVGASFWCLYC